MVKNINKKTITPDDAVEMFGVTKGTLANLRSQKKGCKFYKMGKRVYYQVSEFEKWITSNPVMTKDCLD